MAGPQDHPVPQDHAPEAPVPQDDSALDLDAVAARLDALEAQLADEGVADESVIDEGVAEDAGEPDPGGDPDEESA
ncbi:hypothetical protein [Brevibacterium litoralis]|uniref:hypothetical protein n=1 Tax=Brevibacterium litoralis TaxID=3138935 RepID=UPI0032ECF712